MCSTFKALHIGPPAFHSTILRDMTFSKGILERGMVTYRLASGEIFSFSIYTSVVIDVGLELYRLKRGEKGGLVIRIGSKRE